MNLPTNLAQIGVATIAPFSFCSPLDLRWICKQFKYISGFECAHIGNCEELSHDKSGENRGIKYSIDLPLFKVVDRRRLGGNGEAERRYRDEGFHDGGSLEFEDKIILISTLNFPHVSKKAFELFSLHLGRLLDYGGVVYVVITNPNVEKTIAIFGGHETDVLLFEKIQNLHPDNEIIAIAL